MGVCNPQTKLLHEEATVNAATHTVLGNVLRANCKDHSRGPASAKLGIDLLGAAPGPRLAHELLLCTTLCSQ